MAKEKLTFISILYTIGAILICLDHGFNFVENSFIINTRVIVVYFTMPMFFFCGGLLLKYTNGIERKGTKDFVYGKILRLLVPYIVLSSIFYFPKQILTHETISLYGYFEMLFVPRDNALGHFWFIPVLFNLYFIFALLYKINVLKNKIIQIILLVLFLFLHFKPINCEWLGIKDICLYGVFFSLGYVLSEWIINNKENVLNYKFLILFGILSILACYCIFKGMYGNYYLTLIGFTVLPFFFILCYIIRDVYNNKFFQFFDGKYFTIYLLHWLIEYPAIIIVDNILHLGLWSRVIVFLLGLLIPVFIVNILNRFNVNNKFIRLVLGM